MSPRYSQHVSRTSNVFPGDMCPGVNAALGLELTAIRRGFELYECLTNYSVCEEMLPITRCSKTWRLTDTDLCSCDGGTQMMSHIVESCPLTKLNGGLSQLHFADDEGKGKGRSIALSIVAHL